MIVVVERRRHSRDHRLGQDQEQLLDEEGEIERQDEGKHRMNDRLPAHSADKDMRAHCPEAKPERGKPWQQQPESHEQDRQDEPHGAMLRPFRRRALDLTVAI